VESAATILLPLVPFEGTEKAALALRVQVNRRELDLFGLGVWPDPLGPFYLGPSLVRWADGEALSESDSRLPIVKAFREMWRQAALRKKPRGRPRGTGDFKTREEFADAVRRVLAESPDATQWQVGLQLLQTLGAHVEASDAERETGKEVMRGWQRTHQFRDWDAVKSAAILLA
jgi:hypothetical protein